MVNGHIELKHTFDSMDKSCEVILLVAAIVKRQNDRALRRHFSMRRLFGCQRLSRSVQ
jgi:hypothetical protein